MPLRAALWFGALGVIWGSNFMFMKWATQVITPAQVALLRVLAGLVPIAILATATRALDRAHLQHWKRFAVMSVLATSGYFVAFAAGTSRLPSGIAGALSGTIPLVAFLAAALLLGEERGTPVQLVGVLVGFGGVVMFAQPWSATGALDVWGVLLMLLGSASVGLSFAYARRFIVPLGYPGTALTTYQMGCAALTLLVLVPKRGITDLIDDRRALLSVVLGLGLAGTGVAYLLYYALVTHLGAVQASTASYVPPVVAFLIGWVALHEHTGWNDVAGLLLIATGVGLVQLGRRGQLARA